MNSGFILTRLPVCIGTAFLLLAAGCASLPDNSGRSVSRAYTDVDATTLGRGISEYRTQGVTQDGFVLLGNGLDAFVARAVLAEAAERSLDVQYYLYHDDLVGRLFTGFLWNAAERGVRVRLLVDDMDMAGRDAGIIAFDSHPNIEVRIFNPFDRDVARAAQFVTGFGSITRRMHNKSFTADNSVAILGGRNIGNEYFDASHDVRFADLDVLAMGDVVRDVSDAFDLYWNSASAYPAATFISERPTDEELQKLEGEMSGFMAEQSTSDYMTALLNSNLAQQIGSGTVPYYRGNAQVVVDHPDKITRSRDANDLHLSTQLAPLFQGVEDELIIVSPYFVPGDEGVAFFKQFTDRGVRVRILTNSLSSNDVGVVHAGYAKYRKALLRNGVELYELNKKLSDERDRKKKGTGGSSSASLHAKTFVIDRQKVFIGSLNLDPRSFYENTEIGLVLEQAELAADMAEVFDQDIEKTAFRLELRIDEDGDEQLLWHGYENGNAVTFDTEPHTGFLRRLGVGIMSLLPIESQL